jgi:glycosyltransferase involved in cell wall biosynthesis
VLPIRILQLSKKFPYPLKDGESLAVNYLSKALVEVGCEVTLFAMNTIKHYAEIEHTPVECNHYHKIYSVEVDNQIKYVDAFLNLFSGDSYHISRFVSKEFNNKLIEILQKEDFDIIQLETLYLTPYIKTIRKYSKAKIILRSHNIEHEIWERITHNTGIGIKKYYLKYLTGKLKKYEQQHLNDYDFLISVSDRDLDKIRNLGYKNGAASSPIGLKLDNYQWNKELKNLPFTVRFCFIGAMDWIPNEEGLSWFLDHAWPSMLKEFSHIQLNIAGRNTSEYWKNYNVKNVEIHGEVEDAQSFILNNDIMLVPLLSGSGTRVKILESMACGIPVISTSVGCEGIEVTHKEQILIADTPEEFTSAAKSLIEDIDLYNRIKTNARKFVEKNYDYIKIAKTLANKYQEIDHLY